MRLFLFAALAAVSVAGCNPDRPAPVQKPLPPVVETPGADVEVGGPRGGVHVDDPAGGTKVDVDGSGVHVNTPDSSVNVP